MIIVHVNIKINKAKTINLFYLHKFEHSACKSGEKKIKSYIRRQTYLKNDSLDLKSLQGVLSYCWTIIIPKPLALEV